MDEPKILLLHLLEETCLHLSTQQQRPYFTPVFELDIHSNNLGEGLRRYGLYSNPSAHPSPDSHPLFALLSACDLSKYLSPKTSNSRPRPHRVGPSKRAEHHRLTRPRICAYHARQLGTLQIMVSLSLSL